MENEIAYKNQNLYLKINIYLNRASTLQFRPVLPLYRNQSTNYRANLWDGFYTMAALDWNKLILTTTFSIYYFFFSWRNLLSPSVQPNQAYFSQKHKTQNANLSNNSHKQFYVLLNTHQIKLYTYPDLLK